MQQYKNIYSKYVSKYIKPHTYPTIAGFLYKSNRSNSYKNPAIHLYANKISQISLNTLYYIRKL